MEKQTKNLSSVLTGLQVATNHCSMSVHQLLNNLSQRNSDNGFNKKGAQYLIETLDSLQEIRKLALRKKNYNFISLNDEPSQIDWDKLFENIHSQIEIKDITPKNIKTISLSKGASNYGSFLTRDIPTLEIRLVLPPPPWLSSKVTGN
jgi:hypothetical protein